MSFHQLYPAHSRSATKDDNFLVGKVHRLQDLAVPRVWAQAVEPGVDLGKDHEAAALANGLLEPVKGLAGLAEASVGGRPSTAPVAYSLRPSFQTRIPPTPSLPLARSPPAATNSLPSPLKATS